MTSYALITGALFRAPERKSSKNGKPYAAATIKARADDNRSGFWRVTVFSETAIDTLMTLDEGDALSVQGPMQAQLYEAEGKPPRVSLSIIADTVQPLRTPRKEKATKAAGDDTKPIHRSRAAQAANGPNDEFRMRTYGSISPHPELDDDIGF